MTNLPGVEERALKKIVEEAPIAGVYHKTDRMESFGAHQRFGAAADAGMIQKMPGHACDCRAGLGG